MFDPREKIALFIDGANLYATSRALGFDIDYRKLLSSFQQARLSAARLLLHGAGRGSGIFLDPPADRLARLQRLQGRDQAGQGIHRLTGRRKIKGNMDIELPSMRWSWPMSSTISSSSPATATSARWSRRCSARASKVTRRLHLGLAAADDLRRSAPPGRPFPRPRRCRTMVGRDPVASARAPAPAAGRRSKRTTIERA